MIWSEICREKILDSTIKGILARLKPVLTVALNRRNETKQKNEKKNREKIRKIADPNIELKETVKLIAITYWFFFDFSFDWMEFVDYVVCRDDFNWLFFNFRFDFFFDAFFHKDG